MNLDPGDIAVIVRGTLSISGKITLKDYQFGTSKVPVSIELNKRYGDTTILVIDVGSNGAFILTGVLPGIYDLSFKADHWLRKVITGVIVQ